MDNETLHSLIPLEDYKAILGLDDREDALSRFCLTTATFTIEQYCKRRLFLKKHFEHIEFHGDLLLSLGEYPVREILAVYALYFPCARFKTTVFRRSAFSLDNVPIIQKKPLRLRWDELPRLKKNYRREHVRE
jgi:hypothetical protein